MFAPLVFFSLSSPLSYSPEFPLTPAAELYAFHYSHIHQSQSPFKDKDSVHSPKLLHELQCYHFDSPVVLNSFCCNKTLLTITSVSLFWVWLSTVWWMRRNDCFQTGFHNHLRLLLFRLTPLKPISPFRTSQIKQTVLGKSNCGKLHKSALKMEG